MARNHVGAAGREERILRALQQAGSVSVEELVRHLDTSVATVRRDLHELESRGLLRRTHGGAILVEPLFYEPFKHDSSFQEQIERHADQKRRIAAAAAELVRDGETISLTAGTTTTEVIRNIRHRTGITVVTNTVNVAMELVQQKHLTVFVTGGFLRGDWFSLVGSPAMRAMRQFYVDTMFVGVNGIDAQQGLTCLNPDEAEINRVMTRQARRRIAVADHSKLGEIATYRFCPAKSLQMLITDAGASDKAIAPFKRLGVEVRRV
jgi:DeoR family transcriptional regulator of aga operon